MRRAQIAGDLKTSARLCKPVRLLKSYPPFVETLGIIGCYNLQKRNGATDCRAVIVDIIVQMQFLVEFPPKRFLFGDFLHFYNFFQEMDVIIFCKLLKEEIVR